MTPILPRVVPDRVRAWAQEHVDRPIRSIEPLGGGLTDTISAVCFDAGDPLILRFVPVARWGELGRRHVAGEALGTQLLVGSGLPVPELIATDSDGHRTGDYANLTTWLPGRVRLDPLGPAAIDELARVAAVIHAQPVPVGRRPPPYAFWAPPVLTVPVWSTQPAAWRRAIEIFAAGPPPSRAGLVHRDFHPGNILWRGDRITGVIDWAETSWGPADLDVVHSATNFALLHDLDSARQFVAAYRRHGGVLATDPDAARFWAISDLLGFLPDPAPIVAALIARRPDLTVGTVRGRLDELLHRTLST